MKPIKSILVIAVLFVPALAVAQGYYGPPAAGPGYYNQPSRIPGGFHDRTGRLVWGGSLGLGGMSNRGETIECENCAYNPLSLQASGHVGGMLGPRFALLFEAQLNVQTLQVSRFAEEDLVLTQTAAMAAGQYWVTPQLWLKGGVGIAHLSLDDAYYTEPLDNGVAVMAAAGYEVLSSRYFSVDIQGRLLNGSYQRVENNITAASIGVGINWY